eukprot:1823120-Pyramimonas_sp.AAC.1
MSSRATGDVAAKGEAVLFSRSQAPMGRSQVKLDDAGPAPLPGVTPGPTAKSPAESNPSITTLAP